MNRILTRKAVRRSVVGLATAAAALVGAIALDSASVEAQGFDLSITKTDGVTDVQPGGNLTYTVTASNAGPDDTIAAVLDAMPTSLTAVTWACAGAGGATCPAPTGSGDIDEPIVTLLAGSSLTYTVSATVALAATTDIVNTASVASPGDTNTANNTATPTDTLVLPADLSITKPDGVTTATPGGSVTYTITASNAGPTAATGATVVDTFPGALTA